MAALQARPSYERRAAAGAAGVYRRLTISRASWPALCRPSTKTSRNSYGAPCAVAWPLIRRWTRQRDHASSELPSFRHLKRRMRLVHRGAPSITLRARPGAATAILSAKKRAMAMRSAARRRRFPLRCALKRPFPAASRRARARRAADRERRARREGCDWAFVRNSLACASTASLACLLNARCASFSRVARRSRACRRSRAQRRAVAAAILRVTRSIA